MEARGGGGGRTTTADVITSDQTDVHLDSAAPNRTEPDYLIWNKDSTGVYILYDSQAFLVSSAPPYSVTPVDFVPALGVPTYGGPSAAAASAGRGPVSAGALTRQGRGGGQGLDGLCTGPVAHSGWEALIQFSGNEGVLETRFIPNWVPFADVPMVPFGAQNYTNADAYF